MSERSLDSCVLSAAVAGATAAIRRRRRWTASASEPSHARIALSLNATCISSALTGSSQPPVISRNASARSPRRSRTAETVEASAGVTSTRWRRSVEEAISFSVSRLPNMVTLPQLPDFLGAARVRLTDLQEHLALEGDELCFLQPPANRNRDNFLPCERKYVLFLFS